YPPPFTPQNAPQLVNLPPDPLMFSMSFFTHAYPLLTRYSAFLKSCLHPCSMLPQFLETAIRFLAEGAASGLNVIAVYITEILRVTGFDAALTLPRFTPEGVTTVAQWGLVALIGYWVLSIILRLLIGVMRMVFWVVKAVLVLWVFGLIVTDKTATADTTAFRLAGLVLVCVLLTLFTSASEKSGAVERRLSSLESRLKVVEKRKAQ
uniref:Uncharacterized protein n=1 Tax=Monopterus albus TaxID=43700 RepID=A0A3Q3J9Y5_MONAL